LERDVKTGEYRLTHKLFQIGSVYIQGVSLHKEAMPILAELASLFQETVHLAILADFEVFYLDKIESSQSIGMKSRVASKCPAYCTGVGKAILAYFEEKDFETFFRNVELKPYTQNTITDPEELKIHLKKIRAQGFAIDDSEHEFEVTCVAAPLMDKDGKVTASISVAGPNFRMTREKMYKEIIPVVKESAVKISHRLGYFTRDIDFTPTSMISEKLEES
jgi:IclR family KDG regulon transcriptional repressor